MQTIFICIFNCSSSFFLFLYFLFNKEIIFLVLCNFSFFHFCFTFEMNCKQIIFRNFVRSWIFVKLLDNSQFEFGESSKFTNFSFLKEGNFFLFCELKKIYLKKNEISTKLACFLFISVKEMEFVF